MSIDPLTLLLLITFNALVWWVILSRGFALFHKRRQLVILTFLVGMAFQGMHSVILSFSGLLQPFVDGRILNTAEISFSAVSAYFLFFCAALFLDYAQALTDDYGAAKTRIVPLSVSGKTNDILAGGMIVVVALVIAIEMGVEGDLSDALTPSAIDVKGSSGLLLSRTVGATYITIVEIMIAGICFRLLSTNYAQRSTVRLRIWAVIACILLHASHFAFNWLATVVTYMFGPTSLLGSTVATMYGIYDTLILIPLGVLLVIIIAPRHVVEYIHRLATVLWYRVHYNDMIWLRNLLVASCPSVVLTPQGDVSLLQVGLLDRLTHKMTRQLIECADAIHFLLGSISTSDLERILEENIDDTDSYNELEVHLIIAALSKTGGKSGFLHDRVSIISELPSYRVSSLSEMARHYSTLARCIRLTWSSK